MLYYALVFLIVALVAGVFGFGGISIAGGVGSVGGAVLGALFLSLIGLALPVINVSPFWQLAISGTAILLAIVLNARGEKTQGRLILKKAQHL